MPSGKQRRQSMFSRRHTVFFDINRISRNIHLLVRRKLPQFCNAAPREKRAELRRLCRQRARKSGQKVDCKAVAKRQYQQQQQIRQQRLRQQQTPQLQQPHIQQQPVVAQRQPTKRKTKRRQFKTRNNPVMASQGMVPEWRHE